MGNRLEACKTATPRRVSTVGCVGTAKHVRAGGAKAKEQAMRSESRLTE